MLEEPALIATVVSFTRLLRVELLVYLEGFIPWLMVLLR